MVGWYHSGPKLRPSDLEINELFKRYTPTPVLVIIDVQPKLLGIPTDAYYAIEEIHDVRMSIVFRNSVVVVQKRYFYAHLFHAHPGWNGNNEDF